jgi:hypothetical protein
MLPTTATAAAPPPPTAGPASSPSEPHAALLLALTYMRLRELLSCARTCRGLREAVAGDPLLWLRLVVEPPLSHRITDEALLALTDRAQGRLRSLHLLGCPRVSDAGLLRIVERNHDVTEVLSTVMLLLCTKLVDTIGTGSFMESVSVCYYASSRYPFRISTRVMDLS